MDTTGRALVDHWSWAAEKGVMNRNTAGGIRAVAAQVLSVLENWETVDVKTLDVEGTLVRFQNLKKKDFKPAVLETYKRRFRQAVGSYLAYLEDPGGWKPRTLDRPAGADKANGDSLGRNGEPAPRPSRHEAPQTGIVEYPFPLREGQMIRLYLPRDLRVAEVKLAHGLHVDRPWTPRASPSTSTTRSGRRRRAYGPPDRRARPDAGPRAGSASRADPRCRPRRRLCGLLWEDARAGRRVVRAAGRRADGGIRTGTCAS